MISLGKGVVSSFFTKQNKNEKRSTEEGMIDVHDAIAKILWSRYLIETQAYKISQVKIVLGNKSTILLEIFLKFSSSKETTDINTKYLFVMDRVVQGYL